LTALGNKLTGTKSVHNEPYTKNTSPKAARHETNIIKGKNSESCFNKDVGKKAEDDSISSSSSSKENCEVSTLKNLQKNESQDSPPLVKHKNNKKSKNQLNINETNAKDQKNSTAQQQQKAIVKPLNNHQNQNNRVSNNCKSKLTAAVSPTLNVKLSNEEIKSHSPTSSASSNEGHQTNHHISFHDIILDTSEVNEINNTIKVELYY
jgi:hypothetical protein